MSMHFTRSLVFRTGVTLAAIVLLALVSIVASIVIADRMEGDAAAINVAGSLRMQAYRIGLLLDRSPEAVADGVANFEQRLDSPALANAVTSGGDRALIGAFGELRAHWQGVMKPLLAPGQVRRDLYLARVPDFVAHADHFVRQLQYVSEDKIRMLRVVQGLTMFLTLALVFGAMYSLNADIISPLNALVSAAEATGRGDLDVRVEHTSGDELGVLGQAFNNMADEVSRTWGELEERVREKTAELQRRNDALQMLNRIGQVLAEPGNVQARLPQVLGMIATTLHANPAFFGTDSGSGDFRIITPAGEFPSSACQANQVFPVRDTPDGGGAHPVAVYPVCMHTRDFGRLFVEAGDKPLDSWADQVMRSAAELLANALGLSDAEEDQRQILLMEERAVIARELHDSLAQSLSYLKIQVSRLDVLIARGAPAADVSPILDDLREGLNSAYRQLRELLTTFRLRIEGRDFATAIDSTVEEFAARGIAIQLDYRIAHCALAANEEIHALQVVREALSNVLRHAHARNALVSLRQRADGRVEILVEDDGIGMPDSGTDRRQHHGLVIMRERAATLGGRVAWSPVEPQGTRVTLEFLPAYLRNLPT